MKVRTESSDVQKAKTITVLAFTLFIIFSVLKLIGYTDWSWYNITIPLWAGIPSIWGVTGLLMLVMYVFTRND